MEANIDSIIISFIIGMFIFLIKKRSFPFKVILITNIVLDEPLTSLIILKFIHSVNIYWASEMSRALFCVLGITPHFPGAG
jgi:fructose-specific phosphotransferase system IIC component